MKSLVLAGLMALCMAPATATEAVARSMAGGNCVMQENVTLTMNFNGMAESVTQVRARLDAQINAAKTFAEELEIGALVIQNQNYNIYTQMNNGYASGYNYSGSIGYKMNNAAKAEQLMEKLTAEKIQASLNVNAHRRGNCN